MNLTKYNLPEAVEVDGRFYKIHAGFKQIVRFSELLKNKSSVMADFDFIYKNEIPQNRLKGIAAICEFMNPPQELPRVDRREQNSEIIIDFDKDSDLIYSAFMDCYGIDLFKTNLHWYKFKALLHAVHDCKLSDVIEYRLFEENGKSDEYTKRRRKLYEAWRLPQPEDETPDEALNDFLKEFE